MTRRTPDQIEVYEPDRSYSDSPNRLISFEEGRRRVEAGEASFCKHNRAIRMRRTAVLRAGSLECNQRFIELYARDLVAAPQAAEERRERISLFRPRETPLSDHCEGA